MLFDFLNRPVDAHFLPDECVKEHYSVFLTMKPENMSVGTTFTASDLSLFVHPLHGTPVFMPYSSRQTSCSRRNGGINRGNEQVRGVSVNKKGDKSDAINVVSTQIFGTVYWKK